MLTKQEIAGLRELLAKATSGVWVPFAHKGRCDLLAGDIPVAETHWYPTHSRTDFVRRQEEAQGNAALIAAAVNALPALLDIAEAVDRIRALITEWRGEVADIDSRGRIGDITFGLREQLNECANELEAVLPLAGEARVTDR